MFPLRNLAHEGLTYLVRRATYTYKPSRVNVHKCMLCDGMSIEQIFGKIMYKNVMVFLPVWMHLIMFLI